MGRSESVTLSVGVNFTIKDLLDAMTELNYESIKNNYFTENSIIEDENNFYNSTYRNIVNGIDIITKEYIDLTKLNFSEYKEYLVNNFKRFGDEYHSKYNEHEIYEYKEDDENNLYHQQLLIPINELLNTERWGYSREGTNGSSCNIDITELNNISDVIHKQMENLQLLKNYDIVFIVSQSAG
jgi:hypothetical protein